MTRVDPQGDGLTKRLFQRYAGALDALLALLVGLLSLVSLWSPPTFIEYDFREPDLLGVVLAVVGAAALAFRSRHPVAALAVGAAASLPLVQLGYHQSIGGLPALFALYSVAVSRPSRVSTACAVAVAAAVGVVLLTGPFDPTGSDWVGNTLVLLVGMALGRSVRRRREYLARLEERNAALLAARETATRAALVEERTRIAREMQDLVAHSLTAMTVQAAAARRAVRTAPDLAEEALVAVEATGRSALGEMRRILGVLSPEGPAAQRRPQPGLDDLRELVAAERAEGLDVALTVEGTPVELEPGVALTAYRVVQEALANARAHAGAAAVRVAVRWQPDGLHLEVTDDGRGATSRWARRADHAGHGLVQLGERTSLYGGTLRAGPRRGGGFAVRAVLPHAEIGRVA